MAPAGPKAEKRDQRLLRAISNPLRREILQHLQSRIASPAELAVELHQSLERVTYHVEVLVDCGCLELMETRTCEGHPEHFYIASPRALMGDRESLKAPLVSRGATRGPALEGFAKEAGATPAVARRIGEHGTQGIVSIELDEFGCTAVAEVLEAFLKSIELIHKQSLERVKATGKRGSLVTMICAFLDPPDASPQGLDPPPE